MQKHNLNQQPSSYRKRKCIVYKPNDFFESFDKSQHTIIAAFQNQAESHMVKALSILIDNIRKAGKPLAQEPSSPKGKKPSNKEVFHSIKKNAPSFRKQISEIVEQDEASNPEKEVQEMIIFEKTGKKVEKSIEKIKYDKEEKELKSNQIQSKKHEKLMESLKKLTLEENEEKKIEDIPIVENRTMTEYTNLLGFEDDMMRKKTVTELILCSNAKNADFEKKEHFSPIESEDQEYQITDYSSNESSNDEGDYSERFAFDFDNQPIFGTIFAQGGKNFKPGNGAEKKFLDGMTDSVPHPQPKLNFKPLLDSPKKSKTKKKRLYINKKKVPRWAEDLKDIAKIYGTEHQRKLRNEFIEIFGTCIVEDMQTNSIFNREDNYTRSSTVRWDHKKYPI